MFFRIWVVWYFLFEFINFRPGQDFINVRGLLIQGGYYIYIYIYIYNTTTNNNNDNTMHNNNNSNDDHNNDNHDNNNNNDNDDDDTNSPLRRLYSGSGDATLGISTPWRRLLSRLRTEPDVGLGF